MRGNVLERYTLAMAGSTGSAENRSRRAILKGIGGGITATSVAGCTSVLGSGLDELRLAYMPIYPDMQYFVMQEEGYFDELPIDVSADQFPDGASIVQAYGSGELDVAMFGVVPSLVVIDKGIPAKITAANIKNAMGIYAHDDLRGLWDEHGKDAFAKFEEQKGRKFRFGTFPPGTVPDILLRYWMLDELGFEDVEAHVEVAPMGFNTVKQNLLAGNIDGTSIMEPIPTIADVENEPYGPVALAEEFLQGQPAATVLMRDELRNDHRDIALEFLRQQRRATEFAIDNPEKAAEHYVSVVGEDVVPLDVAIQAMDSPLSNFISDPQEIVSGTEVYAEYTEMLGKTDQHLSTDEIFDFSLYEEISE